jgi:hypothetical protein
MAKNIDTPQTLKEAAASLAAINVKKIVPRKFKQLEKDYHNAQKKYDELLEQREWLETVIKNRQIIIPPKEEGKDPIIKKLTTTEVRRYRKDLSECRLELKVAKKILKSASRIYSKACLTNSKAAQSRVKTINRQDKLKKTISNNKDEIQKIVIQQMKRLEKSKDHRYDMLKDLAFINGSQFNTLLQEVLKEKQLEIYKNLNFNPQVKTVIYRAVREFFGWETSK